MKAEESIRDVATCDLQLLQHQQLWAEIVAHEETYAQAISMGQDQLEHDIPDAREVRNSNLSGLYYNIANCNIIYHYQYVPNTCLKIMCGHQIQEKLKALQEEKETLSDNWQSKQKWLENTYLEQVFYRDTEHMEKITNSQEVSAPVN